MMALLDNGCEGKAVQMSGSTTLKPGKNELMVNSKNLNLQTAATRLTSASPIRR